MITLPDFTIKNDFNTIKDNFAYNGNNIMELLYHLRNIRTNHIQWIISENNNSILPYIQSAVSTRDNQVIIRLMPELIDFNPEYFLIYLEFVLDHEAVHITQNKKMGMLKAYEVKTGFEKMMKYFDNHPNPNQNKGMRWYLQNTHELAARARNLYNEANIIGDYKQCYTWRKYLSVGFKKNGKVMRNLFKKFQLYHFQRSIGEKIC